MRYLGQVDGVNAVDNANALGGRLVFQTKTTGASSVLRDRLAVDRTGRITVGDTAQEQLTIDPGPSSGDPVLVSSQGASCITDTGPLSLSLEIL